MEEVEYYGYGLGNIRIQTMPRTYISVFDTTQENYNHSHCKAIRLFSCEWVIQRRFKTNYEVFNFQLMVRFFLATEEYVIIIKSLNEP